MIDYQPLIRGWRGTSLERWADGLEARIEAGLSARRYGDLPQWLSALRSLPEIHADHVELDTPRVRAVSNETVPALTRRRLEENLQALHPWRKGPFELFGVHIDTEWRSDLKWDRLREAIEPLPGRRVLDVGCGNGYHCWRMLGAGASEVIGIDPSPLFVVQFWAVQKYLRQEGIWVLPQGIEHMPARLRTFDTVFSMGVLYHRRSPIGHLQELQDALRPGGQLVLETLVVEGDAGTVLVPPARYARMGNVWFLPSCELLVAWLRKLRFTGVSVVDVSRTTPREQRPTHWMRFHSLENFLDPENPELTIEGHPAPRRAIVIANAP